MAHSTEVANNELTSGEVQVVSVGHYIREFNEEMSNGGIILDGFILLPSNSTSAFSFTSLNSYPQSVSDMTEGGGQPAL